jgi:adenosylhomocysteine nucleosidase
MSKPPATAFLALRLTKCLQTSFNMRPVLVCFALEEEAAPFRRLASAEPGVSILITGIGRGNAEAAIGKLLAEAVSQSRPSTGEPSNLALTNVAAVLTCGFAGGLNPELRVGDVLFQTAEPALEAALAKAEGRAARFFCAPRIATMAAEKRELRRTTGADAVEMESEAIHAVCRERGIPCATLRVISDTADEDLPLDFNALANADQSLNYRKLALAIARSPGKIPALMRLGQNTKLAAARLADVLAKVVSLR